MGRIGMAMRDKLVVAVTGLHRKHATRLLRGGQPSRRYGPRQGWRVYDDAVREALIVIWESSDRICSKPFKLADKSREGARVKKRYHLPATPYQRLLADPRTSEEVRGRMMAVFATLDPVQLLQQMRLAQQELVDFADCPTPGEAAAVTALAEATLEQFLFGLWTAWQEGEVRPTSRPTEKAKRGRRRPDPFAAVTAQMHEWFQAEPWRTSRELFERLQAEQPSVYPDGQLRTLQRRLKGWRRDVAHTLVFGAGVTGDGVQVDAATGARA